MKYCQDIIKKHGLPDHCCGSCHDEVDNGYSDFCEIYDPADSWTPIAQVCCQVKINYDLKMEGKL